MTTLNAPTQAALDALACRTLGLETVETRNSDSLDFHETAVWAIRKLVAEAYAMGRADAGRA